LSPAVAVLHVSELSAWSGVSVPVHENPNEEPVHPCTLESAEHVLDVNPMQQYRLSPLAPGVAVLQVSDESV
jgi:hypothetical protein